MKPKSIVRKDCPNCRHSVGIETALLLRQSTVQVACDRCDFSFPASLSGAVKRREVIVEDEEPIRPKRRPDPVAVAPPSLTSPVAFQPLAADPAPRPPVPVSVPFAPLSESGPPAFGPVLSAAPGTASSGEKRGFNKLPQPVQYAVIAGLVLAIGVVIFLVPMDSAQPPVKEPPSKTAPPAEDKPAVKPPTKEPELVLPDEPAKEETPPLPKDEAPKDLIPPKEPERKLP